MQNILSTIGVDVSRNEAGEQFSQYVKEELALNADGSVNEDVDAFKIFNCDSAHLKSPL